MADILCFNKDFVNILKDINMITANGYISQLSDFNIFRGTAIYTDSKYATIEHNKWRLDGTRNVIDTTKSVTGYWSDTVSGTSFDSDYSGYRLEEERYLDIAFENYHTKQDIDGITLIFRDSEDFASRFKIVLYYDSDIKESWDVINDTGIVSQSFSDFEEITTDDADDTEHDYSVGRFNKIRLHFMATNNPNRHVSVANIRFGYATWLNEKKFYDLSVLEEVSIVSDTIPINTLVFSVSADKAFIKTLSACEYVELYYNNAPFGSFYLQKIEKVAVDNYTINCSDIIQYLDSTNYVDKLFVSTESTNISVTDVINDIMADVNVLYECDDLLTNNTSISINFTSVTKREALSQVLLSTNAVCKKLRNGTLWFGRIDTTEVKQDITGNLFSGYTITDNNPVSSISMSTSIYTKGEKVDTSNLKWVIKERAKDYVVISIENMPSMITTEDITVKFYFTIVFYQNISGSSVTVNRPYSVTTSIRNYLGELDNKNRPKESGKYLPEKISVSTSDISIRIDRDAINRSTHIGAYHYGTRPAQAIGTNLIGKDQNIIDSDSHITPYLDFTLSEFPKEYADYSVTAYSLNIANGGDVIAVANPNISSKKRNMQELSVQTVEVAELKINGSTDNILDLLMDRYYQYNTEFGGTIITDDLVCGDTIQLELPDMGIVTGTITQLEYSLANKLIANAKIWLYYIEE